MGFSEPRVPCRSTVKVWGIAPGLPLGSGNSCSFSFSPAHMRTASVYPLTPGCEGTVKTGAVDCSSDPPSLGVTAVAWARRHTKGCHLHTLNSLKSSQNDLTGLHGYDRALAFLCTSPSSRVQRLTQRFWRAVVANPSWAHKRSRHGERDLFMPLPEDMLAGEAVRTARRQLTDLQLVQRPLACSQSWGYQL